MSAPTRTRALLAALALALVTVLIYAQTRDHDFVVYDDNQYIFENPVVLEGLTWNGIVAAFTQSHSANWHPLTWLSHMLDVELFGLDAGGHHLMSVGLHALATVLALFALLELGCTFRASLFVAALFALHPTHVESVAWSAERKDVLAGLFWFATLLAYGRWQRNKSRLAWAAVVLCLMLGLLSKPMVVTLPCVLLLLDVWPLGRFGRESAGMLWREKLPLFACVAAASLITFWVQRESGAVGSLDTFTLGDRVANALVSTWTYVGMLFWPVGLACFYPHPVDALGWPAATLAGVALCAVSFGAWKARATVPGAFVGWFWFLGTLVPVIGLVQVGVQSHADRYTYLPYIGLGLALASLAGALIERRPSFARPALVAALALGGLWSLLSFLQVQRWRDTPTLFEHALAVTEKNYVAHNNLGDWLRNQADGRPEPEASELRTRAVEHFREALDHRSDYSFAITNLTNVLFELERYEEVEDFARAWLIKFPEDPVLTHNLAMTRLRLGALDEARELFERAIGMRANWSAPHAALATVFALRGDLARAAYEWRTAASGEGPDTEVARLAIGAAQLLDSAQAATPEAEFMRTDVTETARTIAAALMKRRRAAEALPFLRRAVELTPSSIDAWIELGNACADAQSIEPAVEAWSRALELDPRRAVLHNNLGYARFLAGDYAAAIAYYEAALAIEPSYSAAQENLDAARAAQQ